MEKEIKAEIIRSRRKTLVIEIKLDRKVVVHAPTFYPLDKINAFVEQKRSWIEKHLTENFDLPKFTDSELKELKEKTYLYLAEKLPYYAKIMGVDYKTVKVRKQKTLWGSCTRSGNLSFNLLLALLPENLRDYIIVHELAHRLYMNHQKLFWKTVKNIIPDYNAKRKVLRTDYKNLFYKIS